jgi:hypothetical protein
MTFIKGVKAVNTTLYLVFYASFSVVVFIDVSFTRDNNFNVNIPLCYRVISRVITQI